MDLDKLFEKIPYDKLYPVPNWQRFAAIFGVAAVVVGLFYFIVISGQDEEIGRLEESLSKIQKEVEDNKAHASKLEKLKEKIAKLEVSRQEASKQLPSEKEIPELLEQISNIGMQSGLQFITFKPAPEVMREFYAEVPVNIEVVGKFHNMLMFFDEIANLPRIVTIGDIKILAAAKSGQVQSGKQPAAGSQVQLNCMATTYRFVESAAPGDGKGKSAGAPPAAAAPPGMPGAPVAAPAPAPAAASPAPAAAASAPATAPAAAPPTPIAPAPGAK
ncbi:MAG: type 4a pilus biogenesis protein PilO [Nitrospinae bacterium]|nr:type 4a pilus biogenesis protein PilO [Nitrospinota bacterium]